MSKALFFTTVFLGLIVFGTIAHDVEGGKSIVLNETNFNNYVRKDGKDSWLIMFYAPWCGHCKHALPKFQEFAAAASGRVNVGLVDW
jgi:thioredoxin-like negative regulator of GroEL